MKCNDNIAVQIIKKLGRLFEEYKICTCDQHKKKLIEDIKQLGEKLEKV